MTPLPENYTGRFTRIVIRSGVALFGVIIVILISISFFTRNKLHQQILHRDAFMLQKMAQAIYDSDVINSDFEVALRSSELSGVIAIRIFEPNGEMNMRFPASVYPVALGNDLVLSIKEEKTVTQFYPEFNPEQLFDDFIITNEADYPPVSRLFIPIYSQSGENVAIIEYWIDSENLIEEFNKVDQTILTLTPISILLTGFMLWLILKLSLNNVRDLARTIEKRNHELEQANANLALSAKTSAIGAISAHLFHDLKNPLAGLKAVLNNGSHSDVTTEANALANRIQKLVNETLQFIQTEGKSYAPEFTIKEFAKNLENKYQNDSIARDASIKIEAKDEVTIPGQQIPLITLILHNLVQNAIDAAVHNNSHPAQITITLSHSGDQLEIFVADQSGGISDEINKKLFSPVKSSKLNGSGIGLAISEELARKMNGELKLHKTSSSGSIFKLITPVPLPQEVDLKAK